MVKKIEKTNENMKTFRGIKEMYKDDSMVVELNRSRDIFIYDKVLNANLLKKLLNKAKKHFKIDKEKVYIFVFLDCETLPYHSDLLFAGRCFGIARGGEETVSIITIKIGLRDISKKPIKMALFEMFWNELWHSTGEKGPRFPPKKIMKEVFDEDSKVGLKEEHNCEKLK